MQVDLLSNSATLNRSLAIDSKSVGELKSSMGKDPAGTAKAVAKQFESLFLNMVMKSMREATPKFDDTESETVNTFRGMYDQQLTQNLTSGKGIGLADMVEKQMARMNNPALFNTAVKRPQTLDLLSHPIAAKAAVAGGVNTAASAASSTPEQFVATVGNEAVAAANALGLSPHLMLAHAALESGWGKRPITDAQGNNTYNLFGIKAGANWTGKTADIVTTEYVDGVAQKRVEKFRAYDSYADAFSDYAKLLQNRYGDATKAGSDGKAFAASLQEGGYATDPHYAAKLAQVSVHPALQRFKAA